MIEAPFYPIVFVTPKRTRDPHGGFNVGRTTYESNGVGQSVAQVFPSPLLI